MKKRMMLMLLGVLALSLMAATVASASHNYDGGSYDGGRDNDGDTPRKAVSYINPDTGAATANPDVDPNSNCDSPERDDNQMRSAPGSTANNVHNDACFFKGYSTGTKSDVDGPATFDSSGQGSISACPDPDGTGPKVARLSDTNGDGRMDRCFQSGYQDKGTVGVADQPGDFEFHARMNNTTDAAAGEQRVVWGYDPEENGTSDTDVKDTIRINWL